jgi:beta-galactosidase
LTVLAGNTAYPAQAWREDIRSELEPLARFDDGGGAWWRHGHVDYLATWPGEALLARVLTDVTGRAGLRRRHCQKGSGRGVEAS